MTERPRTHYSRGVQRRDALLKAAIELIAERGIERITFRAVSQQAGFPASTTSYFFSSVDEVIDAAITRVAEEVIGSVGDLVAQAKTGALTRDELAVALVDFVSTPERDDTLAQFEAYLAVRRRAELAPAVHRIMRAIEEATESALGAFGVERPAIPARQIMLLIDGFALHQMARPDPQGRTILADALVRLLDSHLCLD